MSDFLKSRRARLSPSDVGLPSGRRRRTPGLRREEVAELASVGLTWYTWLEQGRDIRVSGEVLAAISAALRLSASEEEHLFRLAGREVPPKAAPEVFVPARLRWVLDRWDPFPAHVTGRRRDLVAWNRSSEEINRWSELPADRRNLLWFVFRTERARQLLVDWQAEAASSVAAFRSEAGPDLSAPDFRDLVNELTTTSVEFAEMFSRHDVQPRKAGTGRIQHPELGRLELEFTSLQVLEEPSLRLYLYSPANEESEAKLLQSR